MLHLRCGDTIPGLVTRIDERGIEFRSTVSDATFVPHEQIQAIELMPEAKSTTIVKQKKERLLTVPRMQRDSPPTQLIRSDDGDYLRCRLLSMNETELHVEVRLEEKVLPRAGSRASFGCTRMGSPRPRRRIRRPACACKLCRGMATG